jgi:hypothetical protein
MPTISSVSPTSNPYINGILVGTKWAVDSLTFSFPTDPSFYGSYGSETTTGFEALTAAQQSAVRAALAQYSSVINFTFTEVTESASVHGDLRFAETDATSTAWAYYPGVAQTAGDVWFNNSKNWYENPVQGNYAYYTVLHEIGHAMGLKHPHTNSATFGTVPLDRDAIEYTVMSYRSYVGAGTNGLTNGSTSYPQTLMMYDIAALQEMYGANFNTYSGDSVYRWDPNTGRMYVNDVQATSPAGNKIFLTVWDGGGQDTYDFSNYSTNLTVNLNPGEWTTVSTTQLADLGSGKKPAGNIANALQYQGSTASLIENAIGGTGNDTITGNIANNTITGGAGNDILNGGVGDDTACFSGTFADYSIVYNLDTSWTITDTRGLCPDGIDILWNFEWLKFYDITVALDSSIFEPTLSAPAIAALLNDSEITTDRITKNAALVLNGTAAASTTIKVYAGIVLLGTTTADASGNWTLTTSTLADGQYQITATATDGSGTTSGHSSQFSVVVDTSAPQTPQITAVSPDSNVAGDRITNSNTITLSGTAEAGAQVHIYDGQTLLGVTTAGQNGQWTFDTSGNAASYAMGCGCADCAAARAEAEGFGVLTDGAHVFTAVSKDTAGNLSATSSGFQVTIDTTAPNNPTITGFSPDSNVSGDGITSARQLTLTGTAEAGSTVKIYDGATLIKTLTADGNGAWSFTTNTLTNATHSFTATATDAAGNTSGSSSALQVVVDAVAPNAPVITGFSPDSNVSGDGVTSANQITLTGTAEANSVVKIYDGGTLIKTLTANGSGAWSFTTDALSNAIHSFTATATDAAGNTGTSSSALQVRVDTVAPNAPVITGFSPDTNVSGDGITSANQLTLTGTAEAGSTVKIYDGATLIKTLTADGSGAWSFVTNTLTNATHSFTATATDAAGNTSGSSSALQVTVDSVVPSAPVITGFSPDTNVTGDGITSANQLTLTGTAAAGATVKVYDGATLIKTLTADGNGAWSFTTNTLTNATHSFTATATDAAGNTSGSSQALQVVVDAAAPNAPVITGFSPDSNISGDGVTSANQLTLTGTAEAGATVKIYDGATLIKTLTANGSGAWSFTTDALSNATHSFTATATDTAGNISGSSSALQVRVDTVAPNAPMITGFSPDTNVSSDGITSANQLTLTGTAEAGATVKVYDGATLIKTLTADGNGAWSFTTSTLTNATHSFTATATDAAGNTSGSSSVVQVVVDAAAPNAPVITGFSPDSNVSGDGVTSANQLTLTGTAEAGATVKIYDGATLIKTLTANGSGAWSFTTDALSNAIHSFTATATDAAGNTSGSSSALQVRVDTVAPTAPVITGFSPDTNVSGDGITSANQLTLSGTAEAGSTVKIYDGGTLIKTLTADGNGVWSFTTNTLTNATHSFTATATDAAGNTSGSSSALQVTVDVVAPDAPIISGFSPDSNVSGDGITNVNKITLTGSAAPGLEVTLYDGETLIGRVTADANGAWSLTTTTLINGDHAFSATASHPDYGTSVPSQPLVVTVDTVAPTNPIITAVSANEQNVAGTTTNANVVTVTGTAEAGSLVTVSDGGTVIGTATADGEGVWSVTATALTEGAHSFTARSIDAAGNQSLVSTAVAIKVDTLAPGQPKITSYSADSGILGDGITNATSIKLSGTAEALATIKIYDGDALIGETVASRKGTWSFTTGTLEHGSSYDFTVTATDTAQNTSVTSDPLSVTIDTVAPTMPQILSYSPGDQALGLTKSSIITLVGTAEAGSTVKLYNGSKYIGATVADDQGAWSFTTSPLANATHRFAATATDAAGNTSALATAVSNGSAEASSSEDHAVLVVRVDTKAPGKPIVSSVSDDTGRIGDKITSDSTLDFMGRAEAGSTIAVYAGDTLLGSTVAGSDGAWSFLTDHLQDGAYNFSFTATDLAGNTSAGSRPLQVIVDTVIDAPVILSPGPGSYSKASAFTIKGIAEAFSSVALYAGATFLGTAKANAHGDWSFRASKLPDGEHSFSAIATDPSGNESVASDIVTVTVDTAAPVRPVITALTANDQDVGNGAMINSDIVTLSGTAEAGSLVTVTDGKTVIGTATADAAGLWSLTAASLTEGAHKFIVRSTDAAGNQSPASTAVAIKVDTLAPGQPKITGYSADSGIRDDGITNATSIKLSGTAEARATIKIYDGEVLIGETVASGKGTWSFTTGTLEHGTSYDFTVTATDAAQNTSATSDPLSITIDTVAPMMPQIVSYSPDAVATVTNANVITLTGTAEPGSVVKLYNGSKALGSTIADDQGAWSFTTSTLANATYHFAATATDAAGNTSPLASSNTAIQAPLAEEQVVMVVTVDTKAPGRPVVSSVSDDTGRVGDKITSDSTLDFSGRAEAGSTVDIYAGETLLGSTLAAANGAWTFLTDELQDGLHAFIFKATDIAGNTSLASRPLQVTVDTTIETPVILGISPDTGAADDFQTRAKVLTITGSAEAYSQVSVFDGDILLGTVKANAAGAWTFKTKALPDGAHSVSVSATDRAGNVSDPSDPIVVTVDTIAPETPAITNHLIVGSTLTLGGTAGANDVVTLYDGKLALGTATADASGNWSFSANDLSLTMHKVSAVVSDAAGNAAKSKTLAISLADAPQYGLGMLSDSALHFNADVMRPAVILDDGSVDVAFNRAHAGPQNDLAVLDEFVISPTTQPDARWWPEDSHLNGFLF